MFPHWISYHLHSLALTKRGKQRRTKPNTINLFMTCAIEKYVGTEAEKHPTKKCDKKATGKHPVCVLFKLSNSSTCIIMIRNVAEI